MSREIITRCTCGHPLEWHWFLGKTGGVCLDKVNGNRCPGYPSCPCRKPTHDGGEPERLPAVVQHRSMWAKR